MQLTPWRFAKRSHDLRCGFVPIRSIGNQGILMHHKVRELLASQRTQLLNALRGHLAEVGSYRRTGTEWSLRIGRRDFGG